MRGNTTYPLFSYYGSLTAKPRGEVSIRFCHYDHRGRFQRSPLLMSMDDIEMMREALRAAPELRESLRKLVED